MKKVVALILAFCLLSMLVACGQTQEGPAANSQVGAIPDNSSKADPVKLTISMWGDEDRAAAYKETLIPFCEEHNCEVEITVIPLADYYTKLSSQLSAGTAPDVFWIAASNERMYITNGFCADLRDTLEADPEWDMTDYFEGVLERSDYIGDGGIYGVPFSSAVRAVFYNKTLFNAAGVKTPQECWDDGTWTYETMFDLAEQIKAYDDTKIGVKLWCNGQSNQPTIGFADILYAYGAQLLNDDSTEFILDSEAGTKVIQMIYDEMFVTEAHAKPGDETAFLSGNVAMARETYSYMKNVANGDVDFEWDIVPLPYGDAGTDAHLYAGYSYWCANADSKNPELSEKLIAFLTNKENSLAWCKTFMAPRISVMSSEAVVNLGEGYPSVEHVTAAFVDSLAERTMLPFTGTPEWNLLATTVAQYYEMIWAGEYTVEEGIAAMKDAVSGYLN